MAPLLYLDVLFGIMALSDDPTISRLMRVNKSLNIEGSKYLLDEPCISMRSSKNLDSLISFLSAYNGTRLAFLRGLSLEMQTLQTSVARRLDDLLTTHATKVVLTQLDIQHLEAILKSCSSISTAFARLTTVTHIRFEGVDASGSEMLRNFQSKVERAVLQWHPFGAEEEENIGRLFRVQDTRIPMLVLRNFQSSLTTLATTLGNLHRFRGDNTFQEVYPLLTDLQLRDIMLLGMQTRTMIRAFPNAQKIVIHQRTAIEYDRSHPIDAQHERNVADQLAHGSWSSLETFMAGILDLYLISPTCPIREVHIVGPQMQTRLLRRILKRTRTTRLAFSGFEGNLFTPALTEMMRKPCVERVEFLELTFWVGCVLPAEAIDAPEMVESWICAISGLPRLRVLGIVVHLENLQAGRASPHEPCAASAYFTCLDVRLLQLFKAEVPSLETVEMAVEGARGQRAPVYARLGPENPEFKMYASTFRCSFL
ncbi:uncharacterized protein BXZ73DRAFT_106913 [Epithele typhae]|uniref:uncharacterized protein n=1 Tax=Epithele typhae TaxID=378194 RepID=UPI002008CC68|nr:uncharacterized protein BXZ73DRAFT_106913 [Epithele typhae]KAH9913572.1 hypothetical protein BXZ73DRAFT_106913 [Epithele typhae]